MPYDIEVVRDLDEAWKDIASLYLAFEQYNQAFQPRSLVPDWQARLRERLGLHDDRLILLARHNREAVGQAVAMVRRDDGLGGADYGYLSLVFVRTEHRGRGVGKELLRHAETWCTERGADKLELDVFSGNERGTAFWQTNGFAPYSVTLSKGLTGTKGNLR